MAGGAFQVTQGTQTQLANDVVGTNMYPVSKIDIGAAGASSLWDGKMVQSTGTQNVGTLNTGTINTGTVNTGTINTGTINTLQLGTVDTKSQLPPGLWGTTINVAGSAFGTIKTLVAGSTIYITDLEINMGLVSGTLALYSGATSKVIGGTWSFNANGGLVTNRQTPIFTDSGSALCYQQQGTAALSITASGFIK